MDYFNEALDISRALAPCANHKDLCACDHCHVPCDPRTREFRAIHLCPDCYDSLPAPLERKKGPTHANMAK